MLHGLFCIRLRVSRIFIGSVTHHDFAREITFAAGTLLTGCRRPPAHNRKYYVGPKKRYTDHFTKKKGHRGGLHTKFVLPSFLRYGIASFVGPLLSSPVVQARHFFAYYRELLQFFRFGLKLHELTVSYFSSYHSMM